MSTEIRHRVLNSLIAHFDRPLIQNDFRGVYVEHMVAELLGDQWSVVSADWGPWDLQKRVCGTRVEIKQSAARQTWTIEAVAPKGSPRFSIRRPKGMYQGSAWTTTSGRLANIYVFAWHGTDDASADHRSAEQWRFFVVRSGDLPDQESIGLSMLRRMAPELRHDQVSEAVEGLCAASCSVSAPEQYPPSLIE